MLKDQAESYSCVYWLTNIYIREQSAWEVYETFSCESDTELQTRDYEKLVQSKEQRNY